MTDPKTIDPSLLHPWLRTCLQNPNLEKQITKDKGDIDVYTVSTMELRLRFSNRATIQYNATVQHYDTPPFFYVHKGYTHLCMPEWCSALFSMHWVTQ